MILETIDWLCIATFFAISLFIGLVTSRKAGSSTKEFFLSGRNMPWWLLGVSMVATTFSADTPNLVTDIVRQKGVSGNWTWWAFLLTGMLTVFVYARLWRRLGVMTDLEFYELRYSGKAAAFLRGFRAVYLGIFFNVVIMATVCLAAIKIGGIVLKLSPIASLAIALSITVIYSSLGGLRGILLTDFFQFFLAMVGSIWATMVILDLPQVGGLANLLQSPEIKGKLDFFPDFSNMELLIPLFILPLAVQWWSVWYPGSEPGGGGYVAQRMLAAKSENHALTATLFFNVAHYALRPWPWIIIALCSIKVFPDLLSIQKAFPHLDPGIIKHDTAYPAMITLLPSGLMGLMVASLIAAFMSTISTHLNWGASYVVNDFYVRFVNAEASEKQLVSIGRLTTVILMIASGSIALFLSNALQAFQILLQIGAGTGLLFILRWFWWRINAYSEITAMIVSFVVALYFSLFSSGLSPHIELCIGVAITTFSWIAVTFLTPATDEKVLISFYQLVQPGGAGWKPISDKVEKEDKVGSIPTAILCMVLGCFSTYSTLFATGYWLYGNYTMAISLTIATIISSVLLWICWKRG